MTTTAEAMAAVEAPKINLLLGGTSNEREISLKSGSAVAQALRNGGFDVTVTDVTECRLLPEMREADVVYPVLHGGFGEDGRIQKVMEEAGLRFVGSGSAASLLTMDKIATKRLLDRLGIPTAKWSVVTRDRRELPQNLKLPLILKVPMEGSTFGIVKVERAEEWDAALEKEFAMAGELLVIIAGTSSIGVLLSTDQQQADMPSAMAIMIVILVLGIAVDALFGTVDRTIRRRRGLEENATSR